MLALRGRTWSNGNSEWGRELEAQLRPKVEVIPDFRIQDPQPLHCPQRTKKNVFVHGLQDYSQVPSHSAFGFRLTQFSELQVTMGPKVKTRQPVLASLTNTMGAGVRSLPCVLTEGLGQPRPRLPKRTVMVP